MAAAVMAPTIDVDKVAMLLKERDEVNNQVRARQTDRVVGALRMLTPPARSAFLKALMAPPPGAR